MFTIKTLVELFDKTQINNAVAGLRFKPEKIVFIGFKEIMSKGKMKVLSELFSGKNIDTEFEIVGRYDYEAIVDKLERIIEKNPDCAFDLTGGRELLLTAMGEAAAKHEVPMFQINVRTGTFVKVKSCENIIEPHETHMNINECVKLNGCLVMKNEKWNLTPEFKRDIEKIWDISRKNSSEWNRQSCILGGFEKGSIDENRDSNVSVILKSRENPLNMEIINMLIKNRLIFDFSIKRDTLTFRYKNEQVRRCILKAGNILELYVYMLMKEIEDEEPGYYDDINIGVFIDWDGKLNDRPAETKNEIDVLAMRDLVPVFVSCKNGEVHKDALYEIEVAAEKFGGEYSKKVLVATYVHNDPDSKRYIVQRAHDMGIALIDNIHQLSRDEIKKAIKEKIR